MAKDESGLIEDSIRYLTFLSEDKENEPQRLLKLATLLELKGETEKATETFKQILIIFPNSPQAKEAEEKVRFFTLKRNSYLEYRKPHDAIEEIIPKESNVIVQTDIEFSDVGIVSKELSECAYTFKAINEQENVPDHRFEAFSVFLGKGANQKEWFFKAEDGISEKKISFQDSNCVYQVFFTQVNIATCYIQDIFDAPPRPAPLFSNIQINLIFSHDIFHRRFEKCERIRWKHVLPSCWIFFWPFYGGALLFFPYLSTRAFRNLPWRRVKFMLFSEGNLRKGDFL
ncbi:hypothetical protein HYY75_01810 [bacterium]|nr:hypothetical protein [bacterium]